jgi:tRNA-splicing ligase RtcB
MNFFSTNIPAKLLKTQTPNGTLTQAIVGNILRNIPVGRTHHKQKQVNQRLDTIINIWKEEINPVLSAELLPELESAYYQIGTLGSGNHFIEIQKDENGNVCIMLHSGSRNLGYKICGYFDNIAKDLNKKWFSIVPKEYDLAFLPLGTPECKEYLTWMNLAMDFAEENRNVMKLKIENILFNMIKKYTNFDHIEKDNEIDINHNYCNIEHHFGKNVWVHRKGAIRLRKGDIGIIPGAMGSYSYIVEGLGNSLTFESCSHGAGRRMGRKKALEEITVQQTIEDLNSQGIVLGKSKKDDVAEESRFAYKNIDEVINNQKDVLVVKKKLKTVGVIKA